jgi:hypothetical protein
MKFYSVLIVIGLFFVGLDFNVNGFQFLPNWLGYCLIGIATFRLSSKSQQFFQACSLSLLLAIWSVLTMFVSHIPWLLGMAATLLHLAMLWVILGGVMELAYGRRLPNTATLADMLRKINAVLVLAGIALGLVTVALPPLGMLFLPLMLAQWMALAAILFFLLWLPNNLTASGVDGG